MSMAYHASMDLVWYSVDANGIPFNPQWGHQVSPGGRPDPHILCGDPYNSLGCTTQPTDIDQRGLCNINPGWYIGGHWNWLIPVTYRGTIYWRDRSKPPSGLPYIPMLTSDDDYNFKLDTGEAGLTVGNDDGFVVEFDAGETIDNFDHPWWSSFHKAVDNGNPGPMINGRTAIVTGLMGLDCGHSDVHAEIHPVWAMGIELINDGYNSLWTMFARNWGNEGYCGRRDWKMWGRSSYTFSIPWPNGASNVTLDPGSHFRTGKKHPVSWSYAVTPNVEVLVTFYLPQPEDHPYVDGTILLHWTLVNPPIVYSKTLPGTSTNRPSGSDTETQSTLAPEQRTPKRASEQNPGEVEKMTNDLLAKMTDEQRDIYFSMLSRKVASDNINARRVEPVVNQLPTMPSVKGDPYPQHVEKICQRVQALRAAYGGQLPGIDPDAIDKCLEQ